VKRKALVVCGPTASGKSRLADALALRLEEACGLATTVAVDSMQVYCEIPIITNQARERPAELVGVVSVVEEWTVARHQAAAQSILKRAEGPVVLDAGTGMYLNAVLLGVPLAPRVTPETRSRAEDVVRGRETPPPNRRRAVREEELRISGAKPRGSIWEGEPVLDAVLVYLRPAWDLLQDAIETRSAAIAGCGLEEARVLGEMERFGRPPNPSVSTSIGVRELRMHLEGEITRQEAGQRIATRTRQLARRQIRWFDKLAQKLEGKAKILIVASPGDPRISHYMHDIMEA